MQNLGLEVRVRFLPSFTDAQRSALLAACTAVVYTPQHEHFGIVPLEAMASARPVVAVNSGGPTESVVHGRTGLLCEPTPEAFAGAYKQLLGEAEASTSTPLAAAMGQAARTHVQASFSRGVFGDKLDDYIKELTAGGVQGKARRAASRRN